MALVLTRRPHESVVLMTPDGARITIQARYLPDKEEVRLVIDAPREVLVLRGELETD